MDPEALVKPINPYGDPFKEPFKGALEEYMDP